MKKFFKKTEGFTLVELIVVIAILGILAGVGTVGYSGYIKKANMAADQVLLDSLNTAFAAACIENGVDVNTANASGITIGTDKTVTEEDITVAGSKRDDIRNSFEDYYLGGEFKVMTTLNFVNGLFVDASTGGANGVFAGLLEGILANNTEEISAIQNSKFKDIGSSALLTQVNDVANLANDFIGVGSGKLYEVVMDEGYISSLATRLNKTPEQLMQEMENMEPDAFVQFMANSTILNVAGTMNSGSFDEAGALAEFAAGNWGALGTTLNTDPQNGLAKVAMLYGLYTAYDQEAASNIALTQDVSALTALANNEAFKTYLSGLNDPTSQASKDYAGYKAALAIVNESANNIDVANQILANGYSDPELLALMQGVIGS